MKKIVAIYPTLTPGEPGPNKVFRNEVEDLKVVTLIDSTVIWDVVANGGMNTEIRARMLALYQAAEKSKPDLIVCGCSSIGETVYHAQKVIDTPIIRIDEGMAREAVAKYKRIGVMATLGTTLDPTCNLILKIAEEEGKEVELTKMVAPGAFEETMAGHYDKAEEIMKDTFIKLADTNDCVLFAQASMADLKDNMLKYRNVPILSSPEFCAKQIKRMLEGV